MLSAIVPVKTFSHAKSRLTLSTSQKIQLSELMLKEVLGTIDSSDKIDDILLVTADSNALSIGEKFNVTEIRMETDSGVNDAIKQADEYLRKKNCSTSIVLPQDIPLIQTEDLDFLTQFIKPESVLIVPSRQFDGTNALIRTPCRVIPPLYDMGGFKTHLDSGRLNTKYSNVLYCDRIMIDIDTDLDILHVLNLNTKPDFNKILLEIIS
ncbi:MAG: 2-phospho-L-lactate guanylyltransferase [Candidatus Nitrosoabyssus spongiisocia]|nr:MAG: 2-phospho-L-lactate guanylyltransferase [Nitrosopumilaceae archaeon AB1(1)]